MKDVFELLREADPLEADSHNLSRTRNEIRRRVVAAGLAARTVPAHDLLRRRVTLAAGGVLAVAVCAFGLLVGVANRGILQAAVRFEVRLAETQPAPGLIVARIADSDRVIYLHPEAIVTNEDIAYSWVMQDGSDVYAVSVQLLEAGAQRMRQATATHIGRPVAILIDGEVVTTPTVRSAISDSAVISGDYTQAEAQRIADGIGMR
jgi:preprotein translocase subunit SecD